MRYYAAIMTGLAANSMTLLVGVLFTRADLIGVIFMAMLMASMAVGAFWIVTDIISAARDADDRERKAWRERSRRRKGVQSIDLAHWDMIDEMGRII